MNKFIPLLAASTLLAAVSLPASAVPSTLGLNADLLTDTAGAWYFNWTSATESHRPVTNPGSQGQDATRNAGDALDYETAVRANNTTADVNLLVTGYSGFAVTNPFEFGTEQNIRQDYWGGRDHNGIGVMTEGTSDDEQVNTGASEYLLLSFSKDITLKGFDFGSGEHHACGVGTNCGGYEVYSLVGDLITSVAVGSLNAADYVAFDTLIVGQSFLIRATEPTNSTGGEFGWYLSGVAGDAAPVSEPASLALLGLGLISLGFAARKRRIA